MNIKAKFGLASAITAAACMLAPSVGTTADLYGGSLKDGYAPAYSAPAIAGPCYLRGDVGYGWSGSTSAEYVGNGVDPTVHHAEVGGGGVYEAGIGCGSGSRGLRGDVTFGFRSRDFKGDVDILIGGVPVDPPIKTTIDSYTAMVNGYYDFGSFRGFVPYVGAGVGVALHNMDYVIIDHPASPNPQHGDTKVDLAWSLMAGVGYQISSNMVLDVGYRYIDMGSSFSSQGDTAQVLNPKLAVDDMTAHEVKIGLRYHFGGGNNCCAYEPMK